MAWWIRSKNKIVSEDTKKSIPDGLWIKCPDCSEIIYSKKLESNNRSCPECGHHFRMNWMGYINLIPDEGTFEEKFSEIKSLDPLGFKDSKKYTDRLTQQIQKNRINEAVVTGTATVKGIPVALGIMDFNFFGGSVGSAVGEKITRLAKLALEQKLPLIIVSASGGMRMQEGALSLMQMAKVSAVLSRLNKNAIPYISLLTHPTTGGTTASWSMLGDLIIAEPKALIGFAGPRVIKQTIGQDLPEGFQTAEFLVEKGFVDLVVHRNEMKDKLAYFLEFFGFTNS